MDEASVAVPWERAGDRSLASSGGGSHLMDTSKDLAQPPEEDGHPKDFTPLLAPWLISRWMRTAWGSVLQQDSVWGYESYTKDTVRHRSNPS